MGVWPSEYFTNPKPSKSIYDIWDDIDNYTFEETYSKESRYDLIDFIVPLPPLEYEGKFIKGVFYSQSCETILKKFPEVKKLFHVCANTMFSSYSKYPEADIYFACYKNRLRENYYRKKYPERKHIAFAPLQDADWTNEYVMAPTFDTPKTIDVICVSTAYPVKNLPVIAKSLKAYEAKYGKVLKCAFAIGSREAIKLENGKIDYSNMREDAKEQLEIVDKILGKTEKYINFIPYIEYNNLAKYYSASKCAVLASLMEGKNRFLNEAMSCNVPVVVFRDFNKFARCGYPVFFNNSGEYANEFTPESLAEAIHKVLTNPKKYQPRKNYLTYNGRKNFVSTLLDSLPYYKQNIPDYKKGEAHNNLWIDLAIQANYQLSFVDYIYEKNPAIVHMRGLKEIKPIIEFYCARFEKYLRF